ncbi:14901_t:CDS:2 [Acaulospora colombiana]|uniref:14901_t:CDS:1 n=1 Tax=Acaulospora colombiana TaxID=27376 RepID=A0ACA9NNQ6_9GLOM|nr:14901_t:CDS:2 [Acaulospora colombiana]
MEKVISEYTGSAKQRGLPVHGRHLDSFQRDDEKGMRSAIAETKAAIRLEVTPAEPGLQKLEHTLTKVVGVRGREVWSCEEWWLEVDKEMKGDESESTGKAEEADNERPRKWEFEGNKPIMSTLSVLSVKQDGQQREASQVDAIMDLRK